MKRQLLFALKSVVVLACLLALWQVAVIALEIPKYILPGPWPVAKAVVDRFPDLAHSLLLTTEAAAMGLAGSVVAGVAVALVFAQWRALRQLLFPYTILLQTVPIVAIAPLIIMWAGSGIYSVALIAFIICLAPIIANTTQGLISVDENLIHLFLMHNATRMQVLFKLRLAECDAQSLRRHSYLIGDCRGWCDCRGVVCQFEPRGGGWAGVCDYLCQRATGDRLSVCAGLCGDGAGVRVFLYGRVSGVVLFA
jgi:hypothetical protein